MNTSATFPTAVLPVPRRATPSNPTERLSLAPGAVLRLHDRAVLLSVEAGRIWLTRSGAHADHFIGAGQTFRLDSAADVVIECDSREPARLGLTSSLAAQRREQDHVADAG